MSALSRKIVVIEIEVLTGKSKFDTCQMVQDVLEKSPLNNSEFQLGVNMVTVEEEKPVVTE